MDSTIPAPPPAEESPDAMVLTEEEQQWLDRIVAADVRDYQRSLQIAQAVLQVAEDHFDQEKWNSPSLEDD